MGHAAVPPCSRLQQSPVLTKPMILWWTTRPQTLTLLSGNFGFITHIVEPAAQKDLYGMCLL